MNTTAMEYEGTWETRTVGTIPSPDNPRPFHISKERGASATMNFTGRSVAVYGSMNWGHQRFGVVLDGKETFYNASSVWLLPNPLKYYADGLDETKLHTLKVYEADNDSSFSLSSVVVTQYSTSLETLANAGRE